MKNPYLAFVVSFLTESTLVAALSTFLAAESTLAAALSTFAESTLAASVLELLLHAAKAPIANTKNSFFIVNIFDVN